MNHTITTHCVFAPAFALNVLRPKGAWSVLRSSLLLGVAACALAAPLKGVTLVEDNFSDYSDPQAITPWYRYGKSAAVTVDSISQMGGNALYWAWANTAVVRAFDAVTLAKDGDYIQASYNVLYRQDPTVTSTGPMLSLYNANGTFLSADAISANAQRPEALTNDVGYSGFKVYGDAASDLRLYANPGGFSRLVIDSPITSLNTGSSGFTLSAMQVYTVMLTITRDAADGLVINYSVGSESTSYTVAAADVLTYTFDEIGINPYGYEYARQAYVNNVLVSTNIPESSSLAAILGVLSLVAVYRLRRKR